MTGPIDAAEVCDPCELSGVDYDVEANRVLLKEGDIVGELVCIRLAGTGNLDTVPDETHNGHKPMKNDIMVASRYCAERIVAGACTKYMISDQGELQLRQPAETSVNV